MATDLLGEIAKLPPGTDLFNFVETTLITTVYPDFFPGFWTHAYLVVTLLVLVILTFTVGIFLKTRAGTLKWILHDGAATRPYHLTWISLLYILNAASLICFTFVLRRDASRRHWSPTCGALWYLAHLPLVWSFIIICHQTLASAPPVRRWLARLPTPRGPLLLNGALAGVLGAMTAAISIPAAQLARIYNETTDLQYKCLAIIAEARAAQNPLMLMTLQEDIARLDVTKMQIADSLRLAGVIYTVNCCLALVCGTIPALVLSSIVQKRIERLERNRSQSTANTWSGNLGRTFDDEPDQLHPTIMISDLPHEPGSPSPSVANGDMELHQRRIKQINPDAPFQNTVITSAFPHRYQAEFDRGDASAAEKAARLRAILVNDQRLSIIYVLCVVISLAQVLYMAADAQRVKSSKFQVEFNYCFTIWAFIIPSALAAALFLQESLRKRSSPAPSKNSQAKLAAMTLPTIAVTQTFTVTAEAGMEGDAVEEKKYRF